MKLSLWDSKTLLILLALGQGAALVYASIALDGHADPALVTLVAIVRGVLVGVGASFAAAYSGFQLPRVKKVVAQKIGWWAFGGLVLCSAFVVGAAGAETPQGPLRWFVSGAYALLTECAVIAVAMASGKMFADTPAEPAKSEAEAKTERKPSKKAPVSAAPLIACKYGCGFERATQAAMNPHLGACKNNPANMPVRVDLGAK